MLMDEGIDTGDILLQEETDIYADDTAESLGKRLAEMSAPVLLKTLQGIEQGTLSPSPQVGTPSFAPSLKKEDGVIDWSKTARSLHDFIRGMYPWPCAYCYLNGERIKIIKATILEGSGQPRRIQKAGHELIVGTGNGLIAILELQPEGKKIMSAKAFLQGRRLKEGTFFDEPEMDERHHT